MEKAIRLDLANESVRHYRELPADFPEKMVKRIRRKFKTKLEQEQVANLTLFYKEIYAFGELILSDFLNPPTGKYSDPSDINHTEFTAKLAQKYPDEDFDILEIIAFRVIYYEYLR